MLPDADLTLRRRVCAGAPAHITPPMLLGGLVLVIVAGALIGVLWSQSSPVFRSGSGPAIGSTRTALPAPTTTSTPTPAEALSAELDMVTTLRGHNLGAEVIPLADGVQCNIRDDLSSPSLQDVQADAYLIFKAIWTGRLYHIPPDWKIHLVFYIGASMIEPGTPIAVANLSYSTAQGFQWAQLTPEQAWQRYDGVLFNANGLCTVPSCAQPSP